MLCRRVAVSLGSNIEPRYEFLRAALAFLQTLHEGNPKNFRASSIRETLPVGCPPDTPPFLNAVAIFYSSSPAHALLDALLDYEVSHGRPAAREKNAPRTIDLDLLFCGDEHYSDEHLILPHPRLASRPFFLEMIKETEGSLKE